MRKQCVLVVAIIGLAGCTHSQKAGLDVSTPESTVIGFTKAAAGGNAVLAQSYFLPGGVDYQDVSEILKAEPGSSKYPARVMLESVDTNRPITVTSQTRTELGCKVTWHVAFGKGFEIQGRRVEPGTEYDFDATLKKTEKGWLIDNF